MSNGQMVTDSVVNVNQAINKQRKNTDPLIKFLLNYKYCDPRGFSLPTLAVPNEFDDYIAYQNIFQVHFFV